MSADNGIYIGIFPIKDSKEKEYRVIEASAIDNIGYYENLGDRKREDAMIARYFGNSEPMSKEKAQDKAFGMAKEFYTEYGINPIEFYRPLNTDLTEDEIKELLK